MADQGRILIITQELDPHADAMVGALAKRGIRPVRFHTRDFPSKATISFSTRGTDGVRTFLRSNGDTVSSEEIKSIWYRRPDKSLIDGNYSETERRIAEAECAETLRSLYRSLDGLWVNRFDRNGRAGSKVLQIQKARQLGFRVPDTLITNEPDRLIEFYEAHNGDIVVKMQKTAFWAPESGLGLYTSKVDLAKMTHAGLIRRCPCVFQENIRKDVELRVTVIGRRVFAAALRSREVAAAAIDVRRGSLEVPHEIHSLPREVEAKVLGLMREFGLQYGAIDMIVTPEGEYVFLELNPNGQFGWIEEMTGLPLYDALADLLISGAEER
jgi:glutathione synthase/RimK-type ligase-like ATP-grasp enzyme